MNQREGCDLPAEALPPRSTEDLAAIELDLLKDLYDDQLLNECYQALLNGQVSVGMAALITGLDERRANSSDLEWQQFVRLSQLHPIRELLHQDPFTQRVFHNPRHQAVDAALLDFVHDSDGGGPPPGTSDLGRQIFAYVTHLPVCIGVCRRAQVIAAAVDRLAGAGAAPGILAVGCGHLREAGLTATLKARRIGRWVAFDSDPDSLQEVARCYGTYGVIPAIGSVRQLLSEAENLGNFDFVYATGLFDNLEQGAGVRLTERLFARLHSGGQLLIPSFLPEVPGRGYMESFMGWRLIYRTPQQVLDLAASVDPERIREVRLLTEELPYLAFLHVTKN